MDKQRKYLLNRERLLEWMGKIEQRCGEESEGLKLLLWELDSMDRGERYDIEEQLEKRIRENGGSREGFEWMARECAQSLRALAGRLEKWADRK